MKFECIKDRLQRAVGLAERATGKKLPLAILGKILIETREKEVIVSATNLDLAVEVTVPAKVSKKGQIAVSGALIESYLGSLPPQTAVTVELVGNNLSLTTPSTSALVATISAEDYPHTKEVGKKDTLGEITAEAGEIMSGLSAVTFSASLSDIKPELAGVYLHQDGEDLVFAATDSFRLAEKRIHNKNKPSGEDVAGIIVPLRNAQELARALADTSGAVTLSFNKSELGVKADGWHFRSRLVEGTFPAYSALLPKSFATQIVSLKEDLLGALRTTHVFADRFHQVSIKVIPDDALFEIQTKNQEVGESTVRVDATIEGDSLDINLNGRFLLDGLSIVGKDSVTLGFNGKDKPMLVRGVGDRSFSYLVMPLNK
ncbi:MAG: DNA polymerase III subunit beta [Candidatus Yanofskybacteria bacterium RIFCSPLOWO2_02_FULL_47_9b]|uniref:Beta sliding clamp n=1 Tax=Candidatus Yanofskybacteria bacterium RIFCSPLOWO2_02_FULL_47_9b TaxID=1802708 RepID=A0A1F8H7W4_9BACT|nr:MAG: DNA polymerase III subunit beta [Candidatus Yanofskybacteria bacterium RIFCSPLOWO2_02_FULL_47_9b]